MTDDWDTRSRQALARDLGTIAREQHQGRSLAELVPWLYAQRPDVVVNKDSSLLRVYELGGTDSDSQSGDEQLQTASALNALLVELRDEPLMHWWTIQRRRTTLYPDSVFPDPVSQRIDDEQRAAFLSGASFDNRHLVGIALHPTVGMSGFADRIGQAVARGVPVHSALIEAVKTLFDDQRVFAYTAAELDEALEKLDHICADMMARLSSLQWRPLSGDELGGVLRGSIAPHVADYTEVPIAGETLPRWLDESLPDGELHVARDFLYLHSGARHRYTVGMTIVGYEDSISLGALDRLMSIPGEITVTYVVRHIPLSVAEKHAERMRNFHDAARHSWRSIVKASMDNDLSSAKVNQGREKMADMMSDLLGRLTNKELSAIWITVIVLCHGQTLEEADETATRVSEVIRAARLTPIQEEMHLLSAFATTLPGSWKECARWRFFTSEAFVRVAPIRSISRGHPKNHYLTDQTGQHCPAMAVLPTDYATPYYYSMHVADLGHGFLVGPSRTGKSTLGNLLITLFRRYPGAQVIVLDKDRSSKIPILLQGGTYIDLSNELCTTRSNPLQTLSPATFEARLEWLELLATSRGYRLTSEDAKDLEKALRGTMALAGNPGMMRLSTVISSLRQPALREALGQWAGDRALAHYFDNQEDGFALSSEGGSLLMGVELGNILSNGQVAIPMIADLFQRINELLQAQRQQGVVRPTLIYCSEVWNLLQYEWFVPRFNNWLKTLAKLAAAVWMDTQSITDLMSQGVFASIRDNIPNRVFLPNFNATSAALSDIYTTEFQLLPNQVARIASAVAKRDYFIQQIQQDRATGRMVRLPLAPDTMACLRSDMAAQIEFEKSYRSGEPDWRERYVSAIRSR